MGRADTLAYAVAPALPMIQSYIQAVAAIHNNIKFQDSYDYGTSSCLIFFMKRKHATSAY